MNNDPRWHSIVTHEQARLSAQKLINSHFHVEPSARACIPVDPMDDDVVITRYIDQQAAKDVSQIVTEFF